MWYKLILFLIVLCGVHGFGTAQSDSLHLRFDYVFGADRIYPNNDRSIYLPKYIKDQRSSASGLGLDFNQYTDIPPLHASVFTGLLTELTLSEGYRVHFDLFAEDRGQSFGSLRLDKIVLYPRIYGKIKKSFRFFEEALYVSARLGDILAHKHNNGLTIDNIDVQGARLKFDWRKWYFEYTLIGDLSQHIGLGIDEFYTYAFGRELIGSKASINLRVSIDQYVLSTIGKVRNNLSLSNTISLPSSEFFTETAYNFNDPFDEYIAVLTGYKRKILEIQNTEWHIEAAYRFYGSHFNDDFSQTSSRFRDLSKPTLANNSVGDFLYPLINAYRPFNQWSVYTEYQSHSIHSVWLKIDIKQGIGLKNLFLTLDYEGIGIAPQYAGDALYNFYKIGLAYKFPFDTTFEVVCTNKLMNLDTHFQTHYQATIPVIGFSIRRLQEYE